MNLFMKQKWKTNLWQPKTKESERKVKSVSHVQLFATPWTVAYQASLSMGFSRQEYWSGLPFPSPLVQSKCYINYNYRLLMEW